MNSVSLYTSYMPYQRTKSQILFEGIKGKHPENRHHLSRFQKLALAVPAIMCLLPVAEYLDDTFYMHPTVEDQKLTLVQKIKWPDSAKVLASTRQQYLSLIKVKGGKIKINGKDETANFDVGGVYSYMLSRYVADGTAKSLPEAHNLLQKVGLRIVAPAKSDSGDVTLLEFPVSSANDVKCWDVTDKGKERFILAIGGSDEFFSEGMDNFTGSIGKTYNVPQENIIKIKKADRDSAMMALEQLSDKVNHSDKSNAEVLIYYHGHGSIKVDSSFSLAHMFDEGAYTGTAEIGLEEKDLKKFMLDNLHGVNTLIILDTCQAGAWIAKNNSDQSTLKDKTIDYTA